MLHNGIYTNAYIFWMLCTIKMKFGQILVCMRNISNLFLAQCWRLQNNSRLFYFFVKLTIKQDLAMFNSWYFKLFSLSFIHLFKKNETLESWHNWLLSNWNRFLNWKEPGTLPQSSILLKRFLKIIALVYIHQLAKFGDLTSCDSKDIFKNAPCLM